MTQRIPFFRKDYQRTPWVLSNVDLTFDVRPEVVEVCLFFDFKRRDDTQENEPMVLMGTDLYLKRLLLNAEPINQVNYALDEHTLEIYRLPESGRLCITTVINPYNNQSLEGLYQSGAMLCTQNEPEGFRRITYFYDRPDVMCVYTTHIIADPTQYATLLANGHFISKEGLPDGRLRVTWHDPFPKPSYLFAVVMGNLEMREDTFITRSGREITLRIYCDEKNIKKTQYAMHCLKSAMTWDEKSYGRECDLDLYMIVAVEDFNAGAMENKGLNIFNSSCILADEKGSTDEDYAHIDRIIAHEYFHNWTGNRITCKSWFELTLKEGLTMFRDAEYTAQTRSKTLTRIMDIQQLTETQFPEDAGPLAHAIRPDSYYEINNFYTATVYSKGREVIRMLYELIGEEKFHEGMNLYFNRYDGQAITTEDFLTVFSEIAPFDLNTFLNWYSQAGTPLVEVTDAYNSETQTYTLYMKQTCRTTPETPQKKPFLIPIKTVLYDTEGNAITEEKTLILSRHEQAFIFDNIQTQPTPSLLRQFSACVNLKYNYTSTQKRLLIQHDSDEFNRYFAMHQLFNTNINEAYQLYQAHENYDFEKSIYLAWHTLIQDALASKIDPQFASLALRFPSLRILSTTHEYLNFPELEKVCENLKINLAKRYENELLKLLDFCKIDAPYAPTQDQIAKRALESTVLEYLSFLPQYYGLIITRINALPCMTQRLTLLRIIVRLNFSQAQHLLKSFYHEFEEDSIVLNDYFSLQARFRGENVIEHLKAQLNDPCFSLQNPNRVNALLGTVLTQLSLYHRPDLPLYELMGDMIRELDIFNPQLSASLARRAFCDYERLNTDHKMRMQAVIKKLALPPNKPSINLYEMIKCYV